MLQLNNTYCYSCKRESELLTAAQVIGAFCLIVPNSLVRTMPRLWIGWEVCLSVCACDSQTSIVIYLSILLLYCRSWNVHGVFRCGLEYKSIALLPWWSQKMSFPSVTQQANRERERENTWYNMLFYINLAQEPPIWTLTRTLWNGCTQGWFIR